MLSLAEEKQVTSHQITITNIIKYLMLVYKHLSLTNTFKIQLLQERQYFIDALHYALDSVTRNESTKRNLLR